MTKDNSKQPFYTLVWKRNGHGGQIQFGKDFINERSRTHHIPVYIIAIALTKIPNHASNNPTVGITAQQQQHFNQIYSIPFRFAIMQIAYKFNRIFTKRLSSEPQLDQCVISINLLTHHATPLKKEVEKWPKQ